MASVKELVLGTLNPIIEELKTATSLTFPQSATLTKHYTTEFRTSAPCLRSATPYPNNAHTTPNGLTPNATPATDAGIVTGVKAKIAVNNTIGVTVQWACQRS